MNQQPVELCSPQATKINPINEVTGSKHVKSSKSSSKAVPPNMYPQQESSKESLVSSQRSAKKIIKFDKVARRDDQVVVHEQPDPSSIESGSNMENSFMVKRVKRLERFQAKSENR